MAVYRNAKFTVGGTDVSSYLRSLALNHSGEALDDTAMGDDTRTNAGGLEAWTIEAEFNQFFSSSTGPDSVFATLVNNTASVVVQPFASAAKPTGSSPEYTGSGLITEYVPMSGNVGDQFISTVSIAAAGSLTRAIAT